MAQRQVQLRSSQAQAVECNGLWLGASLSTLTLSPSKEKEIALHFLVDFQKVLKNFSSFLPLMAQFKFHLINTASDDLPSKNGHAQLNTFCLVTISCFPSLSVMISWSFYKRYDKCFQTSFFLTTSFKNVYLTTSLGTISSSEQHSTGFLAFLF